jgi:hypothetical protein
MSESSRTAHIRGWSLVALFVTAALTLQGCVFLPTPRPTASPENSGFTRTEATIPILLVAGDRGSIGEERIRVTPSDDGELSVDVSETEVGGFGESFQAAAWNSVVVATFLGGVDLGNNYRFELRGRIDGPSAGGITTVALLSLIHGTEIQPRIAMTGTITPTGTIGPVGGVPEKVQAVIDDGGYDRVLIPLGSRIASDTAGNSVDVVRLGDAAGLEVIEVGDVAEAYEHLTGEALPSPTSVQIPRVAEPGYSRLELATQRQLTAFTTAESNFLALPDHVLEVGWDAYLDARESADEAARLLDQGLPGGAFVEALSAAMLMKALEGTYSTVDDALAQGGIVIQRAFDSAGNTERVFTDFLDKLSAYRVKTLADAEALITAYGNAFDAYTLYTYAQHNIDEVLTVADTVGYASIEELLNDAIAPLLYLEFSAGQVEAAEAIFEAGRELEAPALSADADIDGIASFFRRGAEANLNAFSALVIDDLAESAGISSSVAESRLGDRDLAVAMAFSGSRLYYAIDAYLGEENPNSPYAEMGYGWLNYARNASLVEKYSVNGQIDTSTFEITGASSEALLVHSLDYSRGQLARSIEVLGAHDYAPVLIVGAFESAGLKREGDYAEKFDALQDYTGSFAMTRALAYLGGFSTEGYRR